MKTTDTILDKIIAAKKTYLVEQKICMSEETIKKRLESLQPIGAQSFYEALKTNESKINIIAEIKKFSPSSTNTFKNHSVPYCNSAYQAAESVVAISIITERDYFGGSEEALIYCVKNNTHRKPLLRKDFIFDSYQIFETKMLGAQSYLLIAALFELPELQVLIDLGLSLGIEPLVEVHTSEELAMAQQTSARCIGVNCRDLQTFTTDVGVHELLRGIDSSYAKIAESAIDTPEYLAYVSSFSDAALIGTHFVEASSISDAIINLTTAGARQ